MNIRFAIATLLLVLAWQPVSSQESDPFAPATPLQEGLDAVDQKPSKLAVPDEAAQKPALKIITEIFKSDYEQARTKDQKLVLAKKLLQAGIATENDTAGRYVLLRVAKDIASKEGELVTAFQAITEIQSDFEIDALRMKAAASVSAANAPSTGEEKKAIVYQIEKLIDQSVALDRYELARPLGKTSLSLARKAKDTKLIGDVQDRIVETEAIEKAYAETKAALATLQKDRAEPNANLVIGKFHCFFKDKWDVGLPMIALGNDEKLKALAVRDLKGAKASGEQLALADGWYELALSSSDLTRKRMLKRAGTWYGEALNSNPPIAGLVRAKASKRLEEATPFFGQSVAPESIDSDSTTDPNQPMSPASAQSPGSSPIAEVTKDKRRLLNEPIDLLKIASARLNQGSEWQRVQGGIASTQVKKVAKLQIKVQHPAEYDLDCSVAVDGRTGFSDTYIHFPWRLKGAYLTIRVKEGKLFAGFWGGNQKFGSDFTTGAFLPYSKSSMQIDFRAEVRSDSLTIHFVNGQVIEVPSSSYIKTTDEPKFELWATQPTAFRTLVMSASPNRASGRMEAKGIIGKWRVSWREIGFANSGVTNYEFRSDQRVLKNQKPVGSWELLGIDSLKIVFDDTERGRVSLRVSTSGTLAGHHIWKNGKKSSWVAHRE